MHLSQKKSCIGCKAYSGQATCELEYPAHLSPHKTAVRQTFLRPHEPCPKPITILDLEMAKIWRKINYASSFD